MKSEAKEKNPKIEIITLGGTEVDFDKLSKEVQENIAAATLKAVKRFLAQPGGREFLDQKKKEYGLED